MLKGWSVRLTVGSVMQGRLIHQHCKTIYLACSKEKVCLWWCIRVVRGGSWNNNGRNCRSSNRNNNTPDNRNNNNGFRLAQHFEHRRTEFLEICIDT